MRQVELELASTLIRSATKYVAKRTDGKVNKDAYRSTMRIVINLLEDADTFEDAMKSINSADEVILDFYQKRWYILSDKKPGYRSAILALWHARDIMSSIERRFIMGVQFDCPKLWSSRTIECYSEDEGI